MLSYCNKVYWWVDFGLSYFTSKKASRKAVWKNWIFFTFSTEIFQHIVGIPVASASAPFVAYLSFYWGYMDSENREKCYKSPNIW